MEEELLPGVPLVNHSRWARFLEKMKTLWPEQDPPSEQPLTPEEIAGLSPEEQAELHAAQEQLAMRANPGASQPSTPISPSTGSLLAAPVAAQPEPMNQLAMPKPVNATVAPLMQDKNNFSTRVAADNSQEPFYSFLRSKFAGLNDNGTPTLPEAAGLGLGALGGIALGDNMASMGAQGSAKRQLGLHLNGLEDYLTGSRGDRNVARDFLSQAAETHDLRMPSHISWNDKDVVSGARSMEKELANRIAKARKVPMKVLGGGAGLLGAAYLLNQWHNRNQAQQYQGY